MDSENFKQHLKKYLSNENIDKLITSLNDKQKYSCIIIDEEKIDKETIKKIYPTLIEHPFVKNAFLYDKELELGKSLLFEIGAFYILEPCSILVSHFLNPQKDDLILDIAAAPGGKSIHTSFLMKNKGQIISNEISSSRVEILSSNVEKYGRKNISVISTDTKTLKNQFPNTFTKIILDAPCSGSGMFRKDINMKEDWTYNKVLSCATLQKELIIDAYSLLAEGGEMIYSTCSYSYEEDEEVVQYLLNNTDAILLDIPSFNGEYRSSLNKTVHLLPFLYQGEGHYIAKIKKPNTLKKINFPENKNKYNLDGEIFINNKNELFLTNLLLPFKNIRVLRNGIKIGTIDKKLGLIYDHAYARFLQNNLSKVDLSKEETINFIYGLTLNKTIPDGYVNLTYLNIPFALGKVSKNQIKNHYPKGLRKKLLHY